MTWTETHRRWQALREIDALAQDPTVHELPWNDDYAEIFGDLDRLAAALRHRWEQTLRAQVDLNVPERVLIEQCARLEQRHAGVLRLLARYDATRLAVAG